MTLTLTDLRQKAVHLHQEGAFETATDAYALYLTNAPNDHVMWSNLGALYRAKGDFQLAAVAHERALEGPRNAQIIGNASNGFYDAGFADRAVELRRELLGMLPDDPNNHAMLGKYLRAARDHAGADAVLAAALERFPDDAELHIQRAMALLSLGRYQEGFSEFNWRWQGDELTMPDMPIPKWDGQNIDGKTIGILPEQGFGDTVLMARFLAPLQARGAHVLFACKPPLRRLFDGITGLDGFITQKSEFEDCDFWTPMMDLPWHLGTEFNTVPPAPEFNIPSDAVSRAQTLLGAFQDTFNVGVLWSGSTTYRANHKRSFGPREFLTLNEIPGLRLFSLYKGALHQSYRDEGLHPLLIDAAGTDRDFADSAALIQQLDLVISMDSAIVHVAGSLGAPVWNLLHSEPYWLYEPQEDSTPWYPSMRLWRQESSGDWSSLFDRVKTAVSPLAKAKLS